MNDEVDPLSANIVITCQNLEKSFNGSVIFSNVNLQLFKGEIYGLLGPSGCGKTSLLRCILGRLHADKGSILVFGLPQGTKGSGVPGPNVGYMQQDVSLYENLTIAENWQYYGGILGMPKTAIQIECRRFITLLRLPSGNTLIGKLSGGQQRRVAFAAALIHEPGLIILDEPTVGIDSIVKARMWDHLSYLANEKGTCIILTTHYIEEARAAHKVGMMNGGTLAVQDSTESLLERYNCGTLEDVFLSVCLGAHGTSDGSSHSLAKCASESTGSESNCVWVKNRDAECDLSASMTPAPLTPSTETNKFNLKLLLYDYRVRWHILVAVIQKNLLQLCRAPAAFVVACILPSIMVLITFVMLSGTFPDVKITYLNEDDGHLGSTYIALLDFNQHQLINSSSLAEAYKDISTGRSSCILKIPKNFSDAYFQRIWRSPLINENVLRSSLMVAEVDGTSLFVSKYIEMELMTTFLRFQSLVYNMSGMHPDLPEVFQVSSKFKNYMKKPDAFILTVGLIAIGSFLIGTLISVLLLTLESSRGHFERNFVSGVTSTEIILGNLIMQSGLLLIQNLLVMIIGYFFYPPTTVAALIIVYILLFWNGLVGILWGFVIASLFSQIYLVFIVFGASASIVAALGGCCWPYESAPIAFQIFLKALPFAYPTRATAIVIRRANYIYPPELMYSFILLTIWAWIFFFLTLILLQANKKSER